jgi:hypothetical protein
VQLGAELLERCAIRRISNQDVPEREGGIVCKRRLRWPHEIPHHEVIKRGSDLVAGAPLRELDDGTAMKNLPLDRPPLGGLTLVL